MNTAASIVGGKFVLGEVKFDVKLDGDKTKLVPDNLSLINKLDTATTKAFGKALGVEVDPYSKDNLQAPLMGALQLALVAFRDGEVPQTLLMFQQDRISVYNKNLQAIKDGVQDFVINRRPTKAKTADGSPAEPRKANLYRLVASTKTGDEGWDNQQNQKFSIIEAFIRLEAGPGSLKGVSVAELSASIDANPIRGIKTPSKVNVSFYINQFSKEDMNFIEQVDTEGKVVAGEPEAPKAAAKPKVDPPAKPAVQAKKKK